MSTVKIEKLYDQIVGVLSLPGEIVSHAIAKIDEDHHRRMAKLNRVLGDNHNMDTIKLWEQLNKADLKI